MNLTFGVDAPALIQLIKEELKKETDVLEGKADRKWVSPAAIFRSPITQNTSSCL